MPPANQNPEQAARDRIDAMLEASGWQVQNKHQINFNAGPGIAIREYPTDTGPADYALFVEQQACGVIEAKKEEMGQNITTVEDQTAGYANAKLKWVKNNQPLRFQGTGQVLVRSARPKAVEAAALAVDPLIKAGVQLGGESEGTSGPRDQLRGFNEVKAPLLAEATRNARELAEKFAADAGASLGRLRAANQGVIQIGSAQGDDHDDRASRLKRLRVVSSFVYTLD